MDPLFTFDNPLLLDVALAGGKGANLARLTQNGFPVPPGFVVPPAAYQTFLSRAPELSEEIGRLPLNDLVALEAACNRLRSLMAGKPLPEELAKAIEAALSGFPDGTAFSVRSSATSEDTGSAAFAGQHDTFLNCKGANEVTARIRDCWSSLWSARAVQYRLQAGIGLCDTAMAVVVQQMAFCRVAGVGFCLNPVTGDPGQQSLDANYGLGESVVGGECPVDHWLLDKKTGTIITAYIADKTEMVVADASGTRTAPVAGEESATPCLNSSELAALSQLMLRVESCYGYPQDIEWGLEGDQLWLLQSRPVTRIPPRWTRDESAERFPNVVTPLAWDLVEEGFHESLAHSFSLMGLPPFQGKWFALFDNYVYGNQNAVAIYAEGAANSLKLGSLEDLVAALPMLRESYAWVQELPLTWSRDLDRYLLGLGELMAERLDGKSAAQQWDFIKKVKKLGAEYFLPNIAISITQRTLYKVVYGIVSAAVGKEHAAACFDRLLAYCETKTGFINKELYRLARRIEQHPELAAQLRNSGARWFWDNGGFAGYPEIAALFQRFLQDHGHREIDFDPYCPTWLEAPWLVIENLKAMLDSQLEDPAHKERALKVVMAETERQLLAGLPEGVRFSVQEIIRLARTYTALDDIEHYQTTRLTLPFRKGVKALGETLAAMGVIEEPMDVFFAPAALLEQAVQSGKQEAWQRLGEQIATQKNAYSANRSRSPQWELGKDAADNGTPQAGDVLTGLAGSPGCSTGEVHLVLSQDDFADFPAGAVLVARTTNPAWTPLFYKACAVITESGGPLSHGAVTAREVGLPAVMSVRGVLERLKNGQTVTVDGSSGRVLLS